MKQTMIRWLLRPWLRAEIEELERATRKADVLGQRYQAQLAALQESIAVHRTEVEVWEQRKAEMVLAEVSRVFGGGKITLEVKL
jgi:hypothetical protein